MCSNDYKEVCITYYSEMDNGRNTIIRSVLMIGLVKIKNPYQDMYRSPNSLRLRGARNT